MRKIFTSFLTIITALLPATAGAFGIQVLIDGQVVVFSDVSQSAWYSAYVRQSAEAGIVSGYKDAEGNLTGRFGPGNRITVAEALKIAVEGAGYDEEQYGSVINSGVDHWSSSYVAVAKAENFAIVQQSSGRLRLDSPASRAEVASIFTSAFRVSTNVSEADTRYNDVQASTEYAASIEALSRDGVVSGDTSADGSLTGTFRPFDAINRAEVAKIVVNARAEYSTPGEGRRPSEAAAQVVTYSNAGFSPAVVRVQKGDTVMFRNESGLDLWVASDPHPIHTDLGGFDALRAFASGEAYFYTFNRIGSWTYHNHLRTQHTGTVVVEE